MRTTKNILKKANVAKDSFIKITNTDKKIILFKCAENLLIDTDKILEANAIDVENAKSIYSSVMIDRLTLTKERIKAMSKGMEDVAALEDPNGEIVSTYNHPNGLEISKVRVPLGVIGIIYESRPNVTSDAFALCFKSSNVAVLRGGKEAFNTSLAIVNSIKKTLKSCKINPDVVNLIEDTSRNSALEMMKARGLIDLLIPRGGAGLIQSVIENATVPCIETGTGICHIFVDDSADMMKALKIIENAKTSRPSVCNAEEVLLVHEKIADEFLPKLKGLLVETREKHGIIPVELRLDDKALNVIDGTPASSKDFDTEFLDYVLAVKIVKNVSEAIAHINTHGTHHSEAIISETEKHINAFVSSIDSACVYVNASTRFTDGGEFGLGCEMGISTQKMHARGPMGIKELTTYKYIIKGDGQIR